MKKPTTTLMSKPFSLSLLVSGFLSLVTYHLLLITPVSAAGLFGTINNPTAYKGAPGEGLFDLLSNLFKLAGVVAGIIFVIQIIVAGYGYISANGDTKKTEVAWGVIWQSIIGILIIASAFVFVSVIGRLTGINILSPTIYGP